MTDYTKTTNFTAKDSLPVGDAQKKVKGSEFDTEFNAIAVAVGTKADKASPEFTGTPLAPTASAATNTTQIATTAMVQSALGQSDIIDTDQIADDAVTSAKIAENAVDATALNVSGNGTSGQVLSSDGDGSFSWDAAPAEYTDADVKTLLSASGSAPVFAARAWANFNGTNGSINASGNISGISRTSTGKYTVTFTTAMPNTNYAVIATVNGVTSDGRELSLHAPSLGTTSFTLECAREETEQFKDAASLAFVVFG